ncbi:carboxypeptidase regulatory-like domain-containing protein [Fulvivirga sedimenti]|jgi:hypothetical protein|uniref:Carboxypeptidase regulatory-like domain-containing protein n=1 Tax=Fulvivirga sedimenti TaxID=2879465 RepID=A0A9X1KYJ6_9BACT|nr:carboxypeptidase regulatory-like domain-containing protein [Fulvivirga sedimenti]MCA6073681.1 carboxypeptidase regulatory-like domain-containing protein [Fulvivirga sedimenti]
MKIAIYIALIFFMSACHPPQSKNDGILAGQLVWITGNQMPGPDKKPSSGNGVQRVVLIYPPTLRSDCEMNPNGLYTQVPGNPVATVLSDTDGTFIIHLPEGTYSVLTREEEGMFAGVFDGNGTLNPVLIEKRDTTELRIEINYSAAY